MWKHEWINFLYKPMANKASKADIGHWEGGESCGLLTKQRQLY